jgi:hypothetical protein
MFLEERTPSGTVLTDKPMANATPVHRSSAGASITKACQGMGLRQSQQQCALLAIWVKKHTAAGCLA